MSKIYVCLDDVLALLPDTNDSGYKSAYLRAKVNELPTIDINELAEAIDEKMMYLCGCRNCIEIIKWCITGDNRPTESQCNGCWKQKECSEKLNRTIALTKAAQNDGQVSSDMNMNQVIEYCESHNCNSCSVNIPDLDIRDFPSKETHILPCQLQLLSKEALDEFYQSISIQKYKNDNVKLYTHKTKVGKSTWERKFIVCPSILEYKDEEKKV